MYHCTECGVAYRCSFVVGEKPKALAVRHATARKIVKDAGDKARSANVKAKEANERADEAETVARAIAALATEALRGIAKMIHDPSLGVPFEEIVQYAKERAEEIEHVFGDVLTRKAKEKGK